MYNMPSYHHHHHNHDHHDLDHHNHNYHDDDHHHNQVLGMINNYQRDAGEEDDRDSGSLTLLASLDEGDQVCPADADDEDDVDDDDEVEGEDEDAPGKP